MEQSKISEKLALTGEFIRNNKKSLLYVGGSVLVVFVAYTIVKKISQGVGGGIASIFKDKTIKQTAFIEAEVDKTKTSLTDAIANNYANQLYNAMDGQGTDEDTIYAILKKLQKKDDFRKVYNAFGRRSYFFEGAPSSLDILAFGYNDLDLVEWFRKEVGWSSPFTYNLISKTVKNAGFAF